MKEEARGIVLARTLDRLKACVDGYSKKVCLSQEECAEVCVYIWWLTDQIAKAKEKKQEEAMEYGRCGRLIDCVEEQLEREEQA